MSERAAERPRTLTIAPGNGMDVCPLCRIWRMNAGYLRESCGDGYRKPGCFVIPPASPSAGTTE